MTSSTRPRPTRTPAAAARLTARMRAVAEFIDGHAEETLSLARLARVAGMSGSHLQRRFKAVLGVSPKAYQDGARLRRLKSGLRAGHGVAAAIFDAGYGSTSRVYGEAARNIGMTPSAYRAGGAGEHIAYACRTTALGPLMMAATARGVCFAQFGTSAGALLAQLRSEFPRATLSPSGAQAAPALDAWMAALDAHLGRDGPRPEVPLDLRGTAFQIRVWRFLLGIPSGHVVSYAEVAAIMSGPSTVSRQA